MTWYEGTHTAKLTIPHPIERVKAHFSDPATIVAHTTDVESHEIDGGLVHFVLKLQEHAGITKFKADYRCRYALEGNTLRWTAAGGNLKQFGEARFESTGPSSTSVDYTETVAVDMDVPMLMGPLLGPVIAPMLGHEIKEYVSRMVKSLGT